VRRREATLDGTASTRIHCIEFCDRFASGTSKAESAGLGFCLSRTSLRSLLAMTLAPTTGTVPIHILGMRRFVIPTSIFSVGFNGADGIHIIRS
jgi:hypothetical protein